MDEETQLKINQLARNMKAMHLAATLEEAQKRAEEIILRANSSSGQSINEMMGIQTAQEDAAEDPAAMPADSQDGLDNATHEFEEIEKELSEEPGEAKSRQEALKVAEKLDDSFKTAEKIEEITDLAEETKKKRGVKKEKKKKAKEK